MSWVAIRWSQPDCQAGRTPERAELPMQESSRQSDLINFYRLLRRESQSCENSGLSTHYEHVLLGLEKIIESLGPTPEYYEWLVQFGPRNTANQCTFTIDL